ncbi:MAG: glycosyltransferase [Desulfurivibrionaceae bacterium]
MTQILNIITVTKNDLAGVTHTIESTKKIRTHPGVKQIIIDSSTDETKTSVKTLAESNNNVEYFWQDPSGISAAFNKGLSLAESEWVWFLNGGDEINNKLDPDIFLYILAKSSANAIIFQIKGVGSDQITRHPPMWAMWPPFFAWIPHPSTITRKSLYEKYGNFNTSFEIAMDYEFWLRCFAKETVVDTISIQITDYDNTGISSTQTSKVAKEAIRAIKMHVYEIIKIWFKNGLRMLKAYLFYKKRI